MSKKKVPWEEYLEKISDMLNTLSPHERTILLNNISVVKFKKNDIIYKEGELPSFLLCLISGKVKIHKEGVGGRSQIVRVLGDTEYFGYRAYIDNQPFITGASAFETCVILKVPMSIIVNLIQQNPKLGWFFIQKLAHDLGQSDERTVSLTQKHIRGRLAESLLFLKESYGLEADGSTLSIYLTREDLANLSNMTTANAIRTLSAFAAEKLVAIDGRKIKFINIPEIEKISRIG